jgi:hypothetical protein
MKTLRTLRDALEESLVASQLESDPRPKAQYPDKSTADHLICIDKEFHSLVKNPPFSQWRISDNTDFDHNAACSAIQEICPLWTAIVEILVRNPSSSILDKYEDKSNDEKEDEGNKGNQKHANIIFHITNIILQPRNPKTSNKPGMNLLFTCTALGQSDEHFSHCRPWAFIPSHQTIERCMRRLIQEGDVGQGHR